MSGHGSDSAPVIIKKKKNVVGGGHHGGAWKVAYADFATAMMAFFLLMWLLNATTESQRKGLADYFNPSIPISKVSGGGQGALNGDSFMSDKTMANSGQGSNRRMPNAGKEAIPHSEKSAEERMEEKMALLQEIENEIKTAAAEIFTPEMGEHIHTRMTPDGLVIDIVDTDGGPLFHAGSAKPKQLLVDLLDVLGPVLAVVSNDMAVVGHTDAKGFEGRRDYSNWELSTERALAARWLLINSEIPQDQIVEVTGKAATEPFNDDPLAPQNRRIAITLLNKSF